MSLSQSGSSIKEKWIVSVAGGLGDSKTRRVREHVVAAYDKSVEPVLGMKVGTLYFGRVSSPGRSRLLLSRNFFLVENKTNVIFLSQQFGNGNTEEITVILGNISQFELIVRRDPDNDQMILYICDLQVFDPGLIGNVAETVIIPYMFFNILPALFDDLFVHKSANPPSYGNEYFNINVKIVQICQIKERC